MSLDQGAHRRVGVAVSELEGVPLLRALSAVLRHRRPVAGLGIGLAILVLLLGLLLPRSYSSSATFMPQANASKLAELTGLAAQFGFALPAADPGASPPFYASLVESREVLRATVRTHYVVPLDGVDRQLTLVEWYDPPDDTPAAREETAMLALQRQLQVTTDLETGTVAIRVRMRSATLAHQVAERLLALVGEFNQKRRQSQAGAERRFAEGRVEDAKRRLLAAEDRLQAFLQRNRDFASSPQLTFEQERLSREVNARQQLHSVLLQSYEQARIDEVRNTPVVTIVDPPNLPAHPDRRWLLVKVLLGWLAGTLIGLFVALWREFLTRSARELGDAAEEFYRLRAEALHGVRHMAGRITRAVGLTRS